jgi:integrase
LLTAELVSDYDRWLMDKGNAVRTRRAKVGFVLNAWRWGRGRDAFDGRLGTVPTIEMPEPIDEQPVAPTWAQCDDAIRMMAMRLTRHGDELVPAYREPFVARVAMACRLTGLRPLQAANLVQGRHIDREARTLTITRDLPGTKTPQEKRGRIVPLAPVARPIFLAWMAESATEHVIPAPPARALAKAHAGCEPASLP